LWRDIGLALGLPRNSVRLKASDIRRNRLTLKPSWRRFGSSTRISKTVWSGAIRAHFLICFTALLVARIIQHLMGDTALTVERIVTALSAATCQVLKGGIIHLDDVGGAIAFKKTKNTKGEFVETLAFSDEDQIALDYQRIQHTFGTDFYTIYPRQEVFNRFLKSIAVS